MRLIEIQRIMMGITDVDLSFMTAPLVLVEGVFGKSR
jgi:hypothetical protein